MNFKLWINYNLKSIILILTLITSFIKIDFIYIFNNFLLRLNLFIFHFLILLNIILKSQYSFHHHAYNDILILILKLWNYLNDFLMLNDIYIEVFYFYFFSNFHYNFSILNILNKFHHFIFLSKFLFKN